MQRLSLSSLAGLLLLGALTSPTRAAPCNRFVDMLTDESGPAAAVCSDFPKDCSLRGAISAAGDNDSICVPDGNYALTSGQLVVTADILVTGAGASRTFVQPQEGSAARIFHIKPGATVAIEGLTAWYGSVSGIDGGCILNEGELTLRDLEVRNCLASGANGGGIFSSGTMLRLESVLIAGNQASRGGGVAASTNTTILDTIISANTATAGEGGGLYLGGSAVFSLQDTAVTGNSAPADVGGGIYAALATLNLAGSEVSGNSALAAGGLGLDTSTLKAVNTTFSGNTANWHAGGLALDNPRAGSHLSFCTVSGNTADADGTGTGDGGGLVANLDASESQLFLKGCVVAMNTDGSTGGPSLLPDLFVSGTHGGNVQSLGRNFVGANDGASTLFPAGEPNAGGDYAGTFASPLDPRLAALAENGGPTRTRASLPGSPLVNKGPSPCSDAEGLVVTTDQRGEIRPVGPRPDIGAFESDFVGVNLAPILLNLE